MATNQERAGFPHAMNSLVPPQSLDIFRVFALSRQYGPVKLRNLFGKRQIKMRLSKILMKKFVRMAKKGGITPNLTC